MDRGLQGFPPRDHLPSYRQVSLQPHDAALSCYDGVKFSSRVTEVAIRTEGHGGEGRTEREDKEGIRQTAGAPSEKGFPKPVLVKESNRRLQQTRIQVSFPECSLLARAGILCFTNPQAGTSEASQSEPAIPQLWQPQLRDRP